jgi:hypothetical protein
MEGEKDPRPLIVVVEDQIENWRVHMRPWLWNATQVRYANNLVGAEELFKRYKDDIALIAMDACIPGDKPNSMPFVRMVRAAGFTGPMVAMSSTYEGQQALVDAGCDYHCDKDKVGPFVLKLLGLPIRVGDKEDS